MPSIVYQTDHKTGIKYAYESTSYWDKEKKQPRSTRKYIGKVDPETGEIIRKKDRTNHSVDSSPEISSEIDHLKETISIKDAEISSLKAELSKKTKECNSLLKTMEKASALLSATITAE